MDLGSFDNHWYTTLTPNEEEAVGDVLGHVPDDLEEMVAPEPPAIEFEDFYDDDRLTTSAKGSGVLPSQFTSQVYRIPNHKGVYAPFSFEGRRHMLAPYDSGAKEMLFCTARQVEKCVEVNSLISTAKGLRRAADIRVGDRVLALHPTGKGVTWSTVTWVSQLLEKAADETVEIVDADGHRLVCGKEHPVRVYGAWKKAGELQVGDAVERAGRLDQGPVRLTLEGGVEAGLTMALWAAVGICCNTTAGRALAVNIASAAGVSLLQEACVLSGMRMTFVGRLFPNGGSRILLEGPLSGMLRRIAQGELPTIDPRFLPLFLHMLWASRGSITAKDCPRMHLPSWEMLEVVAALHEQAGVWVRQNPRRGTRSPYLSVVQPSFARFAELLPQSLKDALRPVGPRRTGVAVDTLPHGFVLRLVRLWQTRTPSDQDPGATWAAMRCYPRDQRISRTRARELLTVLRRAPGIDRAEWADLLAEVESNTVWSTVTEVKEAGPRAMVDFTVEGSHSFVAQGFVTHNSTFLGNLLLNWSVWVPGHRSLYVSPSSIQTKTFSTDRLKEPIATSEFLRAYAAAGGHQNVHEIEFMNRSRITLRSAFLSADRCLTGDTPVFPVHGSPFTLKEAWDNRDKVVGRQVWATQDGKLVKSRIEAVMYQGVRDVVKVTWHGGTLTMTPDQKLLTPEGWKEVQDIQVGGWIARPAAIPHGPGTGRPHHELALLAYLMGDGSTVDRVSFHSCVPEVLDHVRECALSMGFEVTESEDHRTNDVPTVNLSLSSGSRDWVRGWGLWGKRSYDKRLPELLWAMDESELCVFLDALYSCDGWLTSGDTVEVGYSTSSSWLATEVAHLLLRLGLQATVRRRPPSTAAARESYVVTLRDGAQVQRFLEKVPVLGRREEREQLQQLLEIRAPRDMTDRVPFSYAQLREHLRTRHGLSTHTAWTKHRIQLRPGNRKDSVGRGVLQSIAHKLQDPFLEAMVAGELEYVEITRIEDVGEQPTYDLSVAESENYLSWVLVHNCRGIPAYLLALDEFQDLLPEHLPVIMPCTSHAPERWRRHVFTGTPKSFDNNMEFYRSGFNAEKPMSTMGEWMVPCDHCGSKTTGRFWQALGEENISKKGLVCSRCKKPIQAQNADAQWVHHQPDGRFESYRIPQLMVPWRNWHELYSDYVNYPKAKFYNEVLGLSMDDHSRPLSMSDIRACCDARIAIDTVHRFKPGNWHEPIFAGIDWGGGTSSYTVMVLATYIGGVFTVIWIKRFTGALLDVEEQIQYVLQTLREYNVELVGTDFGYGLQYNDTLIRRYGRDRVAVYQHLGRVTQKVFFDQKVNRFKVFRSMVMADIINMVKRKNIRLPRWEDFREPFAQDFCNITSHLSETQQMVVYTHRQDRPDDSFHAVLYCFLASYIRIPRPDIIKPLHNRYRQEPIRSVVY